MPSINKDKIISFILSLYKGNGSFYFSPQNKTCNLYTTCFAVLTLSLINSLKNFKEKEKVVNFIKNHQEKTTGFFVDKKIIINPKSKFNEEYIKLQLTDFAQIALSELGEKPKYKYRFLNKYKNKDYLVKWFRGLDWKNPWFTSNLIMFILNDFIYEDEKKNKKYIETIMKLLDEAQNSKSGYWGLEEKSSLHNQMAGAYHFLIFYTYLHKKSKYINKIINSTLAIQDYDGLFNYAGGGGACDDLDAVDILCRATFYSKYKKRKIQEALMKSYSALWCTQNEDGGFCWAKRKTLSLKKIINIFNIELLLISHRDFLENAKSKLENQIKVLFSKSLSWRYSNIKSMELDLDKSDIWSTWFRLLAIAIIEKTFPEIIQNKSDINWNMRKMPGLGFYR